MTRLLPALHEGHAPIFLHQAFEDALEAFETWGLNDSEPFVEIEGNRVAISSVFGRMRTCSDILPIRLVDLAIDVVGRQADIDDGDITYAQVAIVLRALCVERLKSNVA